MTEEERHEGRLLWLCAYSQQAFEEAAAMARHLRGKGGAGRAPDLDYWAYYTAMICTYGRPWKFSRIGIPPGEKSRGRRTAAGGEDFDGRLPAKMVPPAHKKTHEALMRLRDSFFAHTDSETIGDDGSSLVSGLDVIYCKNGIVQTLIRRPGCTERFLASVIQLCEELRRKCEYWIQRRTRRLAPDRPGGYRVNLTDMSRPLMLRSERRRPNGKGPLEAGGVG